MRKFTPAAATFQDHRISHRRAVGTLLMAGLLCGLMSVDLQAQQVQAEPRAVVDPDPGYAENALFVKANDGDPVPFYLTINLHFTEVLGKQIIAGTFFELENEADPTAIAFLPTEDPAEFWFLTGAGLYGLITVQEDLSVTWVDGQGNRGFIILF